MGVQSLYGHLSSITVEVGDRINRGETIGRSGATGLAGGDHLHFTVLVAGHPVNPVEWWDPHWVADRVDRKLVEAGIMSAAEATRAPAARRMLEFMSVPLACRSVRSAPDRGPARWGRYPAAGSSMCPMHIGHRPYILNACRWNCSSCAR
jgi:hypothetical protein